MKENEKVETVQAEVTWSELWKDIVLIILALLVPTASLSADFFSTGSSRHWFQRSGAVMILCSVILGYLSLKRHYIKAERSIDRRKWWKTSKNQNVVDSFALLLAILGTLIWAYADLLNPRF